MLKLRKIAVTGGLACGKSTVCRMLEKLGAYIVSADDIVHQLLSPETFIGKKVIELIGNDIVDQGRINRATIAKKVFKEPQLLKSLEEILHPAVRDEIDRLYEEASKKGIYSLFVAEIPLLYESKTPYPFDAVITVTTDAEHCQQRFTTKTGFDPSEWNRRMEHQISMDEKMRKADFTINNSRSLKKTEEQVKQIYKHLTGD